MSALSWLLGFCICLPFVGACIGCSGDKREPVKEATNTQVEVSALSQYVERLQRCQVDCERWALTKDYWLKYVKPADLEANIKWSVICMPAWSEIWLVSYPDIVRQLDIAMVDVRKFGDWLGDPTHFTWTERRPGGIAGMACRMSYDQLARGWLHRWTGTDFVDRVSLERWATGEGANWVWDRAAGRFSAKRKMGAEKGGEEEGSGPGKGSEAISAGRPVPGTMEERREDER